MSSKKEVVNSVVYISWSSVKEGREEEALEFLAWNVEYYDELKQKGLIHSFEYTFLDPNPAIEGFVLLRGTGASLDKVRREEKFLNLMVQGQILTNGFTVLNGKIGPGFVHELEVWVEDLHKDHITPKAAAGAKAPGEDAIKRIKQKIKAVG